MISVCSTTDKSLPILIAALAAVMCFSRPAGGAVTSEGVAGAVQKGVTYLRRGQRANGAWPDAGHRGGTTALAVLALLNAGAGADDPAVARGLSALDAVPNQRTYVVSLKCQVFAASGLPKYRRSLKNAADWLAKTQLDTGMWSYGSARRRRAAGRGDNSNTQFALLGLHEAAKADIAIPRIVWTRARRHFENTQNGDGGWTYVGRGGSYGSMTAAGVASLYISGQRLHVGGTKRFVNGAYPGCGEYKQNKTLAKGIEWLTKNFSVRMNPFPSGRRNRGWLYYYLYALERAGMVSGRRNFGTHDWYREGAEFLVDSQNAQGGWGRSANDTAFAILFLAKGNRPVIIQKLRWKGFWNRNIHDLANFTAFLGDKLGKHTTWQTASLDLSLRELRMSPILFVTGHEFPKFTAVEKKKLRRFVETGGTLLFEACCGSKPFAAGFRKFAKEAFPEYRLGPLKLHHPAFNSYYKLKDTYALEGMSVGCRTGVFFSPKAMSCLWELRTIPKFSKQAFELGTNIAAYATGRELLPDKLDALDLPPAPKPGERKAEVPRGAVRIARLIHDGDYNSDPHCMVNLAALLRDKAKIDVVARARHLRPEDEKIYEYPIVFMHGHFSFKYSDRQIAALRKYLDRGGFLLADACCGKKAFDKSFRETVAKLYPGQRLTLLPKKHPIYTGQVGLALGELRYRKILADELKSRGTNHPPIEAITIKGRTTILYSRYDFTCALEGDRPYSCRGYLDADGRKLAINLALFAISY